MLGVSDYEVIDKVSPFIGAIEGRFRRLDCDSVTEIFTSNMDVKNLYAGEGQDVDELKMSLNSPSQPHILNLLLTKNF